MTDINNTTVVLPDYIRIIERKHKGWLFKAMKPFSTYLNVDINDFELLYGINKHQILVELFRISSGKLGYYIADLRRKQYYYCGVEAEMVKQKLLEIGIGRIDPMDRLVAAQRAIYVILGIFVYYTAYAQVYHIRSG